SILRAGQYRQQGPRNSPRLQRADLDTGHAHEANANLFSGAQYTLLKKQLRGAVFDDFRRHMQLVIEARRALIFHLDIAHDEHQIFGEDVSFIETLRAHVLGAGALHVLQIVDVEDDATRV